MIRTLSPFLFLLLPLAACFAGPDPADVAADRARWQAIRATAEDGAIDEGEAPLLAELLVVWDEKLKVDEAAAGGGQRDVLAGLLRAYGPAIVQVAFGAELQAQAPELFRFVDRNSNGLIDADELLSVDPLDPVFAVVVTTTAARLIRGGA